MACSKSEIKKLIFDYIDGALTVQSAREVAAHLEECSECRELYDDYKCTIAGFKVVFRETAGQCLPNEAIVNYIDSPEALTGEDREALELHMAVCPLCERKVAMLREVAAEESAPAVESGLGWLRTTFRSIPGFFATKPAVRIASITIPLAAILIISLLTIGRDTTPQIQSILSEDIVWLNEAVRRDQEPPAVREKDGWVSVGLPFDAFFDEEAYTVELQSAGGDAYGSFDIDAADYRRPGVRLRIETSSLDSGEYRLVLISTKLADEDFRMQAAYAFLLFKK